MDATFLIPLVIALVFFLIALVVVLCLAAGSMDRGRIRKYIEARGGKVIQVKWSPFGPGWFGEKNERIYAVRYMDRSGDEHEAFCKTSMLTGVYFTLDNVVPRAGGGFPGARMAARKNRCPR
jgi:hypothetical protein